MINSRRAAREWALKILYQMDVGKVSHPEAQTAALERLRQEFVQRGSRSASGSHAEQLGMDAVTAELRDVITTTFETSERVITLLIGRLFAEAPGWQEARLERSLRYQLRGIPIVPARLLSSPGSVKSMVDETMTELGSANAAAVTPMRSRLILFAERMRAQLPCILEPELRKTAVAYAKALATARLTLSGPESPDDWLFTQRQRFNVDTAAHWQKVGLMVQKQTSEWLRVAAFTVILADGVQANVKAIDSAITGLSSGWKLDRQVAVDRNILRIACFEMLFLHDVPTGVSINEAVELAKKYSTAESGSFVNGVLGGLALQVGDKSSHPDNEADAAAWDEAATDTTDDLSDLDESEIEEARA